jgi:NADH dehydrogenase
MILVAGATGSLGGKVVGALLEAGEEVRALVRPGTDASGLAARGVDVALGDLRDPGTLAPACRGVRVIVSTASATNRTDDVPENVDARGNEHLIDAARVAGVEHYILMSTIGAASSSPVPAFRAKGIAEDALRASGIDYTIVQANAFMDVWFGMLVEMPVAMGQPVTLVGESLRRHSFVAERDIVGFIVAAIGKNEAHDRTLPIGGPSAVTLREVVQAYERAYGREIPIHSVAPGEPIPGLPEPVWGLAAALETFDSPMPMETLARSYGVTQTSVDDFARMRLAALSA